MSEYISREELIEGFKKAELSVDNIRMCTYPREEVMRIVYDTPSADVRENIHGHWGRLTRVEPVYSIDGVKTWGIKCQCDKCTFTTIAVEGFGFYDYCPNCGSRNTVVEDKPE